MGTRTKWLLLPRRVASSYGASKMEEVEVKLVGKILFVLHFASTYNILKLRGIAHQYQN